MSYLARMVDIDTSRCDSWNEASNTGSVSEMQTLAIMAEMERDAFVVLVPRRC